MLSAAGQEATVEVTRLLEIDPLTPFNQVAPVWAHLNMGRFALAGEACRQWYSNDRDNPLASLLLGDILARIGSREEAQEVFAQLVGQWPESGLAKIALFLRHALDGDRDNALAAVTPTLTEYARWDLETTWEMATGYALIGETNEALEWLRHPRQSTAYGLDDIPPDRFVDKG